MFKVGIVSHESLASEIIEGIKKELNIESCFEYDLNSNSYIIYVFYEKNVNEAFDYYRVALGIPLPRTIDDGQEHVNSISIGPANFVLLITCIVIYFVSSFILGGSDKLTALFISRNVSEAFYEVKNGQIWRIITPVFLHFSILHILFNMSFLASFGKVLEKNRGTFFFILFVLVTGGLSNISQYIVVGPFFGGMSGVLFGIFGYIWCEQSLRSDGIKYISKSNMLIFLIWHILCLTGVIPNIGNMSHSVGLSVGVLISIFTVFPVDSVKSSAIRSTKIKFLIFSLLVTLITVGVEYYKMNKLFYISII